MSEYIITIDDWFFKYVHERYTHFFGCPIEEIVRCRDCEYSHESESGALYCHGYLTEPWDYYNDAPSMGRKVAPDGFCTWGVRKVDA